jgi:hypothetical protein
LTRDATGPCPCASRPHRRHGQGTRLGQAEQRRFVACRGGGGGRSLAHYGPENSRSAEPHRTGILNSREPEGRSGTFSRSRHRGRIKSG